MKRYIPGCQAKIDKTLCSSRNYLLSVFDELFGRPVGYEYMNMHELYVNAAAQIQRDHEIATDELCFFPDSEVALREYRELPEYTEQTVTS